MGFNSGFKGFNPGWEAGLEFLYGACARLIVTVLGSGQENWSSSEERDLKVLHVT